MPKGRLQVKKSKIRNKFLNFLTIGFFITIRRIDAIYPGKFFTFVNEINESLSNVGTMVWVGFISLGALDDRNSQI
jgi:hypothetical protein